MKTTLIKPLSEKKGGVLIFFALSLIALTVVAGLALDAAHLYGVKSQLQVAADAAALAGANALTGTDATTMQTNATTEATTVGAANVADVYSSGTANAGQPIPVTLLPGDIICGIWDGTTFKADNTTAMNAVEVIANRRGAGGQQLVQNGLINVLSVLGATGFDQTGVTARAIASRTKPNLVPVAVNEYMGDSYPNSYMRATNVDGSPGWGGQTFAILGADAASIPPPNNMNGFICLDYRCDQYDGNGNWYSVSSTGNGTCSDALTPMGTPNNGDINRVKHNERAYLDTGIPAGMVPPSAVREPYNPSVPPSSYWSNEANYYLSPPLPPPGLNSQSPFATVPHFSGGGSIPGVNWKVGDKLLVMVYDGNTQGSGMDVVTVVGYAVIQVDKVGPPTWTGHAIPNGIAGQDDPYIIQPTVANPTFSCSDVMQALGEVQQKYPVAKLVDSNEADMHYGVGTH
ncbi:MAG: pilus assembly protein TadG-related protein [Nitrospirota bacterium]